MSRTSDSDYHEEMSNLVVEFLNKYDIWYTQDVYNLMDDAIDVYVKYHKEP